MQQFRSREQAPGKRRRLRSRSSPTGPNNFRIPQLTYDQDHPGEDLPGFHFAFEVTPGASRASLAE
jgi:hypothetical protein